METCVSGRGTSRSKDPETGGGDGKQAVGEGQVWEAGVIEAGGTEKLVLGCGRLLRRAEGGALAVLAEDLGPELGSQYPHQTAHNHLEF